MSVSLAAIMREMRRNIEIHKRGNFTSKDRDEIDEIVKRIVDRRGFEPPETVEVDSNLESILTEEIKTLING